MTGFLLKGGYGTHGHPHRESTVKRHREKTTIYKPRERPGTDASLTETNHADFLILDF